MIKFLKEKWFAVLLLSVIFTFSSLFWTRDTVYNQRDLSDVALGWPIVFVIQDYSQLSPPDQWFANRIGFGIPQEYPASLRFSPLFFSIAINFLIIFNIVFAVVELNSGLLFLRRIVSVKYVMSAVGLALLAFVSFFVIFTSTARPQMGVGIPPPYIQPPQPKISGMASVDTEVQTAQPLSIEDIKMMLPVRAIDDSQIREWKSYSSQKLGIAFKYPSNYLVVEVEKLGIGNIGTSTIILIMEDTSYNREIAKRSNSNFDYVIPEDRKNAELEGGYSISLSKSVASSTQGVAQWFENNFRGIGDQSVNAFAEFLGIDSVIYKGIGKYTFDGVIFEKSGYLYQFDVQYDSSTLAPRSDFYKIISTVKFE